MRITILGCSGGIGADLRTTCLMLDDDILVDAGTGVGDLKRSELLRIKAVFLTHSHLDHIALLPLLASIKGSCPSESLKVYALPETIDTLRQHLFNSKLWPDYTVLPSPSKPYLEFRAIQVGQKITLSGRSITALPTQHAVPGIGYQFDSGKASFVFSGDTDYYEPFWQSLRFISNLRYLMVEITFPDSNKDDADAAGHMRSELLAEGLNQLEKPLKLLITHMEPGSEAVIMAEIRTAAEKFKPRKLRRGQIFEI